MPTGVRFYTSVRIKTNIGEISNMDPSALRRVLSRQLDVELYARGNKPPGAPAWADFWYDANLGGAKRSIVVEARSAVGRDPVRLKRRQESLASMLSDAIPILAVPRLSRIDRERLRSLGVNHVDLLGNIWIRHPGILINVDGGGPRSRPRPRPSSLNPFSKKASLVLRVLLHDPSRSWGVRELAREASLSVGYTSDLLNQVAELGYAASDEGGYVLADAVALLRDWCSAYRWEDNEIHSFVAAFESKELLSAAWEALHEVKQPAAATILSALDLVMPYVRHDQVHLYVLDFSVEVERVISDRLSAEPVGGGGNLHLMVPYYRKAAFYESRVEGRFRVVSDIQLFLDLIHYPVRGPEAADQLLRRRLQSKLGLSREGVEALREAVGLE